MAFFLCKSKTLGGIMSKEQMLAIKQECFQCTGREGCTICSSVTADNLDRHVFGVGNINAPVVFIGQNPGAEEVKNGKPFVGRSGKVLDRIITAIGLQRKQVYITNIVKGYTDNNKTPTTTECNACGYFLTKELEVLDPIVVVAVGSPSLTFLADEQVSITRQAGKRVESSFHSQLIAMPHPAAFLRNQTQYKPLISQTIQAIRATLRGT